MVKKFTIKKDLMQILAIFYYLDKTTFIFKFHP